MIVGLKAGEPPDDKKVANERDEDDSEAKGEAKDLRNNLGR